MKLIAIHDSDGRISTLLAVPPNCPPAGIEIKAHQLKTELDATEMKLDVRDPHIQERLTDLIENHIIECGPGKAKLVKKPYEKRSS